MKKLLLLSLLLSNIAFSQEKEESKTISNEIPKRFEFGYQIGGAFTRFLNYEDKYNIMQRPGYPNPMIGAVFSYKVTENISFVTNINYEQKGNYIFLKDGRILFNYIVIPVLIRIEPNTKKVTPFLNIGFYNGFIVKQPFLRNSMGNANIDEYSTKDLGFTAGAGLKFKKDNHYTYLEIRHSEGIRDIQMNDIFVKNQSTGLVLGTTFGF